QGHADKPHAPGWRIEGAHQQAGDLTQPRLRGDRLFEGPTAGRLLEVRPFDLHRHRPAERPRLFAPGPDLVGHPIHARLDRRWIDQVAGEGGLRAAGPPLAVRIDGARILPARHAVVPGAGFAEMMLKEGQGLTLEVRASLYA